MIEYKILETAKPEAGEAQLNELGADGWNLVTIVSYDNRWFYYFSRRKMVS